MKIRIDAGTDIAMIGAWDESRNAPECVSPAGGVSPDELENEAAEGHLFLIQTDGDGSWDVDVICGDEVPADVAAAYTRKGREFLVRIPTGRLIVGGVEDYRSRKPQITAENSVVRVTPGDYSLRCWISNVEEDAYPSRPAVSLRESAGEDDFLHFRKMERARGFSSLIVLIFLLWAFIFRWGWRIGLPSAVVVSVFFFGLAQRLIDRSIRYRRVAELRQELFRQRQSTRPPDIVFELTPIPQQTSLKGGSVSLE